MMNRRHWMSGVAGGAVMAAGPWCAGAAPAGIRRRVFVHGRSQQGRDPGALKAEWLTALKGGAAAIGQALPLNWQWVQAVLRALDKNSPGMGQETLEAFTRDVFLYVTRAGVRDEIDRIAAAALTEEPTIVVSHSLGTVVSYSVLRNDRRALQVPLLVTLGSPLAVRSVRDQFRPLGFPQPVGRWYNAFDTRDVVSLYPLDANNFPLPKPIENNPGVRNPTDNRHGATGYLDDAEVVRHILSALEVKA